MLAGMHGGCTACSRRPSAVAPTFIRGFRPPALLVMLVHGKVRVFSLGCLVFQIGKARKKAAVAQIMERKKLQLKKRAKVA